MNNKKLSIPHICGTPNAMCDCSCYEHEDVPTTSMPKHKHSIAIFHEGGKTFAECTIDCPTMRHMDKQEMERRIALSEELSEKISALEQACQQAEIALVQIARHASCIKNGQVECTAYSAAEYDLEVISSVYPFEAIATSTLDDMKEA